MQHQVPNSNSGSHPKRVSCLRKPWKDECFLSQDLEPIRLTDDLWVWGDVVQVVNLWDIQNSIKWHISCDPVHKDTGTLCTVCMHTSVVFTFCLLVFNWTSLFWLLVLMFFILNHSLWYGCFNVTLHFMVFKRTLHLNVFIFSNYIPSFSLYITLLFYQPLVGC